MASGKYLLLLAAFLPLVKCQQNQTVFMLPNMTQVFVGDLLLLKCNTSSRASTVKWTLDGKELKSSNETLRIAAAAQKDSGSYKCETNGKTSNGFSVTVMGYAPTASLTIRTGHPVMQTHTAVILGLENDDGLKNWSCRVMRGEETRKIKLVVKDDPVSLNFQSSPRSVPEIIYWCVDKSGSCRSNQVVIRTSAKRVSLEMYPLPAVAGETLTLKCLVWGTNKNTTSVFYKNGTKLQQGSLNTYTIKNMTESEVGTYKCDATYRYVDQTVSDHKDTSDPQDVPLYESPVRAELSDGLHCSCPKCDSRMSSYRYYKKTGDSWTMFREAKKDSGTYQCRAVMDNMRTLPSRSVTYSPFPTVIVVMIVLLLLLGLIVSIVAYMMFKKRRVSGAVYEDVGLKLRGDAKDPEYDTIQPGKVGSREKKGGEYEALKKEEMKESEYHTLGMEGASGGEGGYQELKKGKKTDEVYHTLGDQVEAGGDRQYECLKKEEIQKGEYEALQTKEADRKPDKHVDVVEEIDENK